MPERTPLRRHPCSCFIVLGTTYVAPGDTFLTLKLTTGTFKYKYSKEDSALYTRVLGKECLPAHYSTFKKLWILLPSEHQWNFMVHRLLGGQPYGPWRKTVQSLVWGEMFSRSLTFFCNILIIHGPAWPQVYTTICGLQHLDLNLIAATGMMTEKILRLVVLNTPNLLKFR